MPSPANTTPTLAIDAAWEAGLTLGVQITGAPGLQAVFDALDGQALIVGGAVRDGLLHHPGGDIDLATPILPDDVAARLDAAGLKAVPTGIAHGTVTAVVDGVGYEITTLRADVSTDGRNATVAFASDIAVDARRRDFTMNALYATREGRVIDPLGGVPDVMARRVRFIGDPEERIREDYLRILRFFRFSAWHGATGEGGIDAEGLAACAALADGMVRLAAERVGNEFRRLLAAPDPAPAVASMAAAGVLMRCLPGADPRPLAPLVHVERLMARPADWRLRLAAIGGENIAEHLRLSRAEARTIEGWRAAAGRGESLAATAHRHGAEAGWAVLLLNAVAGVAPPPAGDAATMIDAAANARLPIAAGDLVATGLRPGPALGAAMAAAEQAWIDSGFSLDKTALLTQFGGPREA